MQLSDNRLEKGLTIMELEERLETVQMAGPLDGISFRCDRSSCDCEEV